MMSFKSQTDTICALSTPQGIGGIAVVRVSGADAVSICQSISSIDLSLLESHTAKFGRIIEGEDTIDEVVFTIFRAPASFTGENTVEIACHGSVYIQNELLRLLCAKGARLAEAGEYSMRAYLNGKMDLTQTEAVADLIASNSKAAHRLAVHQMKGGFGDELKDLRQKLLDFASLIELELDFSQEDVEFADRSKLIELVATIKGRVSALANSFKLGNVIRNGVPVAIVGPPNAGKSTLLNALLKEEKAIVSEIAGTTRDVIDDTIVLNGIEFRFIDTAGIRDTSDTVESIGIERAYDQIRKARIILLLLDVAKMKEAEILEQVEKFKSTSVQADQDLIVLYNKIDQSDQAVSSEMEQFGFGISAKAKENLDQLTEKLLEIVQYDGSQNDLIVTNVRHYEILCQCEVALARVEEGLSSSVTADLLAMDIRAVLNQLGDITGQITNDELLGNIFSNFCIGK